MKESLLRCLINKSYFKPGTEVDATFRGRDFSGAMIRVDEGSFTVTAIYETKNTKQILMDVCSTCIEQKLRIGIDSIIRIEGMTPERFAANYMIADDGSEIKPSGRRRGRRPKNWVEDSFDDCDDDDDDIGLDA